MSKAWLYTLTLTSYNTGSSRSHEIHTAILYIYSLCTRRDSVFLVLRGSSRKRWNMEWIGQVQGQRWHTVDTLYFQEWWEQVMVYTKWYLYWCWYIQTWRVCNVFPWALHCLSVLSKPCSREVICKNSICSFFNYHHPGTGIYIPRYCGV